MDGRTGHTLLPTGVLFFGRNVFPAFLQKVEVFKIYSTLSYSTLSFMGALIRGGGGDEPAEAEKARHYF